MDRPNDRSCGRALLADAPSAPLLWIIVVLTAFVPKLPAPSLQIVSDAVAGGGVVADAVVWGSALLLLVVVCAVAFVAPALRTIRLDVPRARALQVD